MTRSTWLTLLLALSLALGVVLACAGGDDDDSTGNDDDAGDDDTSGECELADLCAYDVDECGGGLWDSAEQCVDEAPAWLAANCTDPDAMLACLCTCFNAGTECATYLDCTGNCAAEFCS
jgi:hypothetical protein